MGKIDTGDKDSKKEEEITYTFEDWLKYRLPSPSEDPDMFRRTDEYGSEEHIESLVNNGKMNWLERNKIIQAKQKVFHKSVELNSTTLFHSHKNRAVSSKDKDQYLTSLISEIESGVDSKTIRKINVLDTDVSGIYAVDYIRMIKNDLQDNKMSNLVAKKDVNWDDDRFLIIFNDFQMHTYMHRTKLMLQDYFNSNIRNNTSGNDDVTGAFESHDIRNFDLRAASGRIRFIESIYQFENNARKFTWEQALNKANEQAGCSLFAYVDSFHSARNSLNKREKKLRELNGNK